MAARSLDALKKQYGFTASYKPDNMDYDLSNQIVSISKLAWIKFLYFNFAVVFLIASIMCIIFNVVIRGQIWQ